MKKLFKVLAIIAAITGFCAAAYYAVKKYMESKQRVGNTEENYVSCSLDDEDFTQETVA